MAAPLEKLSTLAEFRQFKQQEPPRGSKSAQKLNLDLSQTVHFDLAGNVNKMLQVYGEGGIC